MYYALQGLVLFIVTSTCHGIYECCPGNNVLSANKKKCENNKTISLSCPNGVAIAVFGETSLRDLELVFFKNGTLINQQTEKPIRYCQSVDEQFSTNKTYIICYIQDEVSMFEDDKLSIMAFLGYVSLFFVILTIIIYATVPKLLDLQGICIMHTLVALAVGYTFLGIIQLAILDDVSCHSFAFITYFSFLYLFFWLTTLSFHIWRTTVNPTFSTITTKWALIYHIFAITGPAICLIILSLAHFSPSPIWDPIRPGIGISRCWFETTRETVIFFYGPIIVLLIANVTFYLWTVIVLSKQLANTRSKILKFRLKLCVRLCIIMGITWTFEIITAFSKNYVSTMTGSILLFILDLFNLLQGFLIFLVLVVFRKRVRRALASKNPCKFPLPNSWKYLEDEERETHEERADYTIVNYKDNEIEIKQ